ncbi:hypothetical protein ACIG47_16880 [Promicromonospora sp. NPDC052451]|uniref:hypothetical protein n=1 Tax=Promicromonospora sp. NPDC052451 TaxID=3364407 RepID=UPI0037C6253D
MTLSAWLKAARPVDGGLIVPGRPQRRACEITFTPAGARLGADEVTVDLPYDHYAVPETGATRNADQWKITAWVATGAGAPIGIAVLGTGRYAAPIAQLHRRGRAWMSIADHLGRPKAAPLDAASIISFPTDADRSALDALCRVLASKPDWRPQLADPTRTAQFLHDLARQDHRPIEEASGLRRRTLETLIVMRRLGYMHRLQGRPLPDESLPEADRVVRAVVDQLSSNSYALPPDERTRALVHRYYLDVTPWPFAALLPVDRGESGVAPS